MGVLWVCYGCAVGVLCAVCCVLCAVCCVLFGFCLTSDRISVVKRMDLRRYGIAKQKTIRSVLGFPNPRFLPLAPILHA